MPKSKDAFRTISEVAEWLDTPAHVLRFWESKFTQVKPVKRAGGRRYYRPADMQLLGGIKKLLHDDGLTIKGAQKLLREHGVKHVAALSQPLDDDLLDDPSVQEAAFEADAQPEPETEPASTVLSFPSRTETQSADAEPTAPVSEPVVETLDVQDAPVRESAVQDAHVQNTREQTVAASDEQAEFTPSHETTDHSTDTPAFGSDALPAFLRRAPATPQAPSAPEADETREVAHAAQTEEPAKLTINPEVRFEPVEQTPNAARAESVVEDQPQAQPVFSHRAESIPADPSPNTQDTQNADDSKEIAPTEVQTPVAAPPIAVDVPSIAKIAPELNSFEAPAGVLAALPGARHLTPALANQLSDQLTQLRALRDRMQSQ